MATTSAKSFEEFEAKLLLTDTQRDTVKARRSTTHGYLAESFGAKSDMPLRSTKLIGSADRGTIIRPLDDVDVLAVFDNAQAVYDKYRLDSRKFLYRVRDALNSYKVEVVGARGQAVRLFYQSPPHVDVAPVLPVQGGGYYIPAGDGTWLTTNPDRHASWMDERNQALGYHLKPLVRILRRWNREHSKHFKSFHLEVMTATLFTNLGSDRRAALQAFFERPVVDVNDPATGASLATYMPRGSTRRTNAASGLAVAADRALKARAAEARGDHQEAIRLWRIVLGGEFPAYG